MSKNSDNELRRGITIFVALLTAITVLGVYILVRSYQIQAELDEFNNSPIFQDNS